MGKYQGFLQRWFGKTTWGETLLMCGISMEVHDAYQHVEDLNHESNMSLRSWSGRPLVDRRGEIKDWYQSLGKEIIARGISPVSGGGKKGKKGQEKGKKGQEKGKGAKRQWQFRNWTDRDLTDEHRHVGEQLDRITYSLQEGKLTSGEELVRPFRTLPMFVGVVLTGFGGTWITRGNCVVCGNPHDTARCCRCQAGICEAHGLLLTKASRARGSGEWQGSSSACCKPSNGCEGRQQQILDFWRQRTGEQLQ